MKKRLQSILPGGAARRRLTTAVLLVLSLLPHSPGHAAASDVQLEITPAEVQLAPGEATEILALVRNLSPGVVQDIQLRWFTDVGITVQSDTLNDIQIQPGGTLAWSVHITQTAAGQTAGIVYFQLNYSQSSADGAQPVPGVAVGTLGIQQPPSETVDNMAEVRIETALDQIQEQRPAQIFLIVRNLASVPITVTRITAYQPGFINLHVPDLGPGLALAPQASQTFTVPVTVSDTAQTGQQRLLFEVGLAWVKSGRAGSGSLLAAHTVNVGILGESDLLKLVGVPSFLFLPGFLMLTTFLMLWNRLPNRQTPSLAFTVPDFALISITLSLVTAIVYPLLTRVVGEPRNYLQGYGLQDIFQVWFGSVVAGLMSWIVIAGSLALRDKYRRYRQEMEKARRLAEQQAQIERRTPKEDDMPLQILRKMALNDVKFPLAEATVHRDSTTSQCFIILPATEGRVWVAPSILLKRKRGVASESGRPPEERAKWIERFQQAANSDPAALAKVVEEGASVWDFTWGKEGPITHPTPLDPKEVTDQRKSARQFIAQA